MANPIACAISLKHSNPERKHSRAWTTGADWGDRARDSSADARTASSEITQDDSGRGERNHTSGTWVVWLSARSAAQPSQRSYRSGSALIVEVPEPRA